MISAANGGVIISGRLATHDLGVELSNLGIFLVGASKTCEITHSDVVLWRKARLGWKM